MQSRAGVTLVGAGEPRREDIEEALKSAPCLVAADGGADRALALGFAPEAVIGDLDSLTGRAALGDTPIFEIDEQETTDFEKCLSLIDASLILACGFAEARIDHSLAVYSALARRIGPPTIVIGSEDIVFAAPDEIALDLPVGTRVSLFPMAPLTGRSAGLEWPIEGLGLTPMGRIGTSNRVTGPVRLAFDAPGMLVILPRETLPRALTALTG